MISIVNYIEDKRNVLHDTKAMTVPVLLLVEDDIRYYSLFLPVIYTEIIGQSRRLLNEALNVAHKLVRMRARPKILLCSNYEEAEREVLKYREYLFGVISDVEFPRAGELNREAGFELAGMVRDTVPDVPIVLQSSRTEFMHRAHDKGYAFLQKRSPTLLGDLRKILTEEMGFGDFVFHLPDGKAEVARAGDLNALENLLHTVPEESLAYHGQHNHFSHWLMARTEFALAQKLRPRTVSDFGTLEDLRRDLIESIAEYRRDQSQALIGEFNPATFQSDEMFFLQIGGGSLGGKARGLAFIRHILRQRGISRSFAGVRVTVPPTLVLTTEVFDRFLDDNDLLDLAIHSDDDAEEIERRFLQASFSDCTARQSARLSRGRALSAGCALVQSAGGLAVPAVLRRLRDFHAGELSRRHSGSSGAIAGGDQTGLRLNLQPACEGLCQGYAVSPGRREDGGGGAESSGRSAR